MRPSITLALFLGAALTVTSATVGCHDSNATAPQQTLDNRDGTSDGEGNSGGSDSGSTPQPGPTTEPADPAPGSDTAITSPPVLPASYTLTGIVHVVLPGSDTTRTVPVAGATVRIYRVKAADGSAVPEVHVGTATSDALGDVVFRDLSSAYYRLDVKAPAGGPYGDASRTIAPSLSSQIAVLLLLPRKS